MNIFWLTFRLERDLTYQQRYDRLYESVRLIGVAPWWIEPTSFILFQTRLSIDDVARTVKSAIDPRQDVVLIGMPHFKDARVVGACKDANVFKLIDFAKAA